jgi:hypothetical protein
VHPDVSFVHANGGAHLPWSKSSWNGIHLRKRIFVSRGISLPDDLGVPEGPAVRMCLTLQSQPGLRIGLLAERRFACRKDRTGLVPSGVDDSLAPEVAAIHRAVVWRV